MTTYIAAGMVKAALGLAPDDPADDDLVELSIEAASAMIDEHCRRRFDQVADVRLYDVCGDVVEVDDVATTEGLEVAIDIDGDQMHERVLQVGEFKTWPLNSINKGRPIEAVHFLPVVGLAGVRWRPEAVGVRVTATFGWPAVPSPVRQATLALALRLVALRGPFGVAGSAEAGQQSQAQAWTAAGVEGQLAPFVRKRTPVVA